MVHSELLAAWQDRKIIPPAFYLCGADDITRTLTDTSRIGEVTTDLRGVGDVPAAAPPVPPETGASPMSTPLAAAALDTSRAVCGSMVLQSTVGVPGRTPASTPSSFR